MKDLLNIIDETDVTCLYSCLTIAEKLMNDFKLQVNRKFYRIVDCEFYYHSKKHPDPFVHGHQRQKESRGEWYFHGSGLDITLSNGEAYGGILIRAIAEVKNDSKLPKKEDAFIGPLNVCTEIFKQIGNVMADKPVDFGMVDISSDPMGANMRTARVFSVPRIRLNTSKDQDKRFHRRPYRFITFLHLPHKENDKVKRYLIEEADDPITVDQYKQYYQAVI